MIKRFFILNVEKAAADLSLVTNLNTYIIGREEIKLHWNGDLKCGADGSIRILVLDAQGSDDAINSSAPSNNVGIYRPRRSGS